MHGFAEDDDNITDGKLVHLPQQQGEIDEVFIERWVTFDALQVVFVCLVLIALAFTSLADHVANAPVCHRVLDNACCCSLCGRFLGRERRTCQLVWLLLALLVDPVVHLVAPLLF